MQTSTLTEANKHVEEIIANAARGVPQLITKYGKKTVVVISYDEYLELSRTCSDLSDLKVVCDA
ncbi:MAG: type II toxin-antitoxin system prevent-host-death family antitoxin [Pyrinomonadaceae bacterium]